MPLGSCRTGTSVTQSPRRGLLAGAMLSVLFLLRPVPGLADGDQRPPAEVIERSCATCHGELGLGKGAIPKIRGLPEQRFLQLMKGFKSGSTPATVMNRIAQGYRDEDFLALARLLARP